MKRLASLCLIILMAASFAHAQGLFSFGAQGSFANLNVAQPLDKEYGFGFGGGLHGDFHLGFVTLRLNGDYTAFGADHDAYTSLIYDVLVADYPGLLRQDVKVDGGGTIGILSFGLNGKVNFPGRVISPYAIVGLGTATLSISDLQATIQGAPATIVTGLSNQTRLMTNLGAGIDFPLGKTTLFLEAKYTWVFTDNEKSTYLPVTLGVTF